MSKISEVINKLQELKDKHGDLPLNIHKQFDKNDTPVKADEIFFDDELKDIYIGIYN